MDLIGAIFAYRIFPTQFFFCLRRSKKIRGKLGTTHVVEYVLFCLQTFLLLNPTLVQAAVQAFVAKVLKYCEVYRGDDAGSLCGTCEIFIVRFDLIAEKKPLVIFAQWRILVSFVIGELLFTALDSKIGLRKSNRRFSRITILGNQIACVSSEFVVADLPFGIGTDLDHFVHLHEMVFDGLARVSASFNGFGNYRLKVPVFHISKKLLQISRKPVFNPILVNL